MDKMDRKCKVIAVASQKVGVSKSTTTINLGIGLARMGKKVLLLDIDPQGSLTASMGIKEPDKLDETVAAVINSIMEGGGVEAGFGILTHEEGVQFLPANIDLSDEKPAAPAVKLQRKKLNEYFPADYSAEQMEEVIYSLLKKWKFEQGNIQEE